MYDLAGWFIVFYFFFPFGRLAGTMLWRWDTMVTLTKSNDISHDGVRI